MKIDISQKDLGTLCICAIRYCHGRQTYMPDLVRSICRNHLREMSDKDLGVMIDMSRTLLKPRGTSSAKATSTERNTTSIKRNAWQRKKKRNSIPIR